MNKKEFLSIILTILTMVLIIVIRFTNIELTEGQLFIKYWWAWLGIIAFAIGVLAWAEKH